MRNKCQTPGLRVLPKTRIAFQTRNSIRLFAGPLRDRRLIPEEEELREKSITRTEPTNP